MELLSTRRIKEVAAKAALESQETFASVLHVILLDAFGDEIYDVTAVELWEAIKSTWDVALSDSQLDRVMALLLSLSTDAFFEDPDAFQSVCLALSGVGVSDGLVEKDDITFLDMMWAIHEVKYNLEEEGSLQELFSPAVLRKLLDEVSDTAEEKENPADADLVTEDLEQMHATLCRQLVLVGVNPQTYNYVDAETDQYTQSGTGTSSLA